jgi:hypothetical protein
LITTSHSICNTLPKSYAYRHFSSTTEISLNIAQESIPGGYSLVMERPKNLHSFRVTMNVQGVLVSSSKNPRHQLMPSLSNGGVDSSLNSVIERNVSRWSYRIEKPSRKSTINGLLIAE